MLDQGFHQAYARRVPVDVLELERGVNLRRTLVKSRRFDANAAGKMPCGNVKRFGIKESAMSLGNMKSAWLLPERHKGIGPGQIRFKQLRQECGLGRHPGAFVNDQLSREI